LLLAQSAAQELQQAQLTLDAVLNNSTTDPVVLASSLTAAANSLGVQPFSSSTADALSSAQVSLCF
jgi:hypothetical protein